jgi:hypothetical protein
MLLSGQKNTLSFSIKVLAITGLTTADASRILTVARPVLIEDCLTESNRPPISARREIK